MTETLRPADEFPHAPGTDQLWNESWYLDWFNQDAQLAGYVRIGLYPNLGVCWYWACCSTPGGPFVTITDHEVPLPAGSSLELRSSGLWADHIIEAPLEFMTVNCEGFGLELDHPSEVYANAPGRRVPFGFSLEFETDRFVFPWPPLTPRYEIPCVVSGEVMIGNETFTIDGWGQRDHSWGAARDWWSHPWSWSAGRLADGSRFHSAGGFSPESDFGVGYCEVQPDGDYRSFDRVPTRWSDDGSALPSSSVVEFGDEEFTFVPEMFVPQILLAPDGRVSRFPRALCSVQTSLNRSGHAWVEWNLPMSTPDR